MNRSIIRDSCPAHGVLQAKRESPDRGRAPRLEAARAGAVALYYKGSVLSQDLAWFRQQKYVDPRARRGAWTTPADFHADGQRALGFPSYYAKNLASWIDCVAELAVPDESGMVLVFRRYDAFARRSRSSRRRFSTASRQRRAGFCSPAVVCWRSCSRTIRAFASSGSGRCR